MSADDTGPSDREAAPPVWHWRCGQRVRYGPWSRPQARGARTIIITSMVALVTPTAGGVLLAGDAKGNFLAVDAASGSVLVKKDLSDPIGGGISTYMLGGAQYVAVAGAEEPGHQDGQ
jgi:hypothetical protein